jgi:integrase
MKGSVTKYIVKGSSRPKWRYRLRVGKDEGGNQAREGRGGFAKEGEARDAMDGRIKEIKEQRSAAPKQPPKPPEVTLGAWLRAWIETYATQRCQRKTIERYRQLAAYITTAPDGEIAELAQTPLSDIRRSQIKLALFALLRAKGKRREHLSAHTVRHVAGLLSVALSEATELELLTANPMLRMKGLPTIEHGDARSLTPDEIRALRAACQGDWTFALVEVSLASGARRGELLALTWADIDWVSRALTVNKSLEQTADGLRIKSTKSKKPRHFRLSQGAIVALQFQREQQQEHRRMFAADYQERGLIFAAPNGDFLKPDLVSQVIVRRLKKAGITDASMHSLRHSHASNLISRGVPVPAVSARLGHADVSITNRIYAHAIPDDDLRAADEWDGLIDGPVQ